MDRSDCGAAFNTTHWSVVLAAGKDGGAARAASPELETLCRAYWPPLYAFARRSGQSVENARDLTQGFFAKLIEKNWVADVDRARGRFRTFLLTAYKRHLSDEFDRMQAQKRGGGIEFVSIDASIEETRICLDPANHRTPELAFEERWALALLERVLTRLREEFVLQGREWLFDAFKEFLVGDPAGLDLCGTARNLGLNEGAARMILTRLRQRYRKILRSEVAQTVARPAEIEDELRYLYRILSGDPV